MTVVKVFAVLLSVLFIPTEHMAAEQLPSLGTKGDPVIPSLVGLDFRTVAFTAVIMTATEHNDVLYVRANNKLKASGLMARNRTKGDDDRMKEKWWLLDPRPF